MFLPSTLNFSESLCCLIQQLKCASGAKSAHSFDERDWDRWIHNGCFVSPSEAKRLTKHREIVWMPVLPNTVKHFQEALSVNPRSFLDNSALWMRFKFRDSAFAWFAKPHIKDNATQNCIVRRFMSRYSGGYVSQDITSVVIVFSGVSCGTPWNHSGVKLKIQGFQILRVGYAWEIVDCSEIMKVK